MANYGTQGRVRASSEFVQAGEGEGLKYMTTIFTLHDQPGPDGRPIIEVYLKTLKTTDDGIAVPAKAMSEKKTTVAGIEWQYPAVEHGARFALCFRALVDLEMAKVQVKYDDELDVPVLITLQKNRTTMLKNFVGGNRREMHALAVGSKDGDAVGLEQGDVKNGHICVDFLQISYKLNEPIYRGGATRGGDETRGGYRGGTRCGADDTVYRGGAPKSRGFGAAGTVAGGTSGVQLSTGYMTGRTDPFLAAVIDFRYVVFDPKVAPPTIAGKKPKYESVEGALSGPPPLHDVLPIME
jgi:hypothetical protein